MEIGAFSVEAHHSNKQSDAAHHLRIVEDHANKFVYFIILIDYFSIINNK